MQDNRREFLLRAALTGSVPLMLLSKSNAQDAPLYLPANLANTANNIGGEISSGVLYAQSLIDHQAGVTNVANYISTTGQGPALADAATQTIRANPVLLDQAAYYATLGAQRLGLNVASSFTNLNYNSNPDYVIGALGGDLNILVRGYASSIGVLADQINQNGGIAYGKHPTKAHLLRVQQRPMDPATAGVVVSAAGVMAGVGAVFVAAGLGAAIMLGGGALAVASGIALVAIGLGIAIAGGILAVQATRDLIYYRTGPPPGSMPGDCNGPAALRSDGCPEAYDEY